LFNYTNNNACIQGSSDPNFACGWFYPILLFSIFAIVIIATKDRQPMQNSLALGAFITFIGAAMLMALGLAMIWVEIFFVLLVLAIINLWRSE
jgi:hypothetical protein